MSPVLVEDPVTGKLRGIGSAISKRRRRWGKGDIDRWRERGCIGVIVREISRKDCIRVSDCCIDQCGDGGGGRHQYEHLTINSNGGLL